MKSCNVIKGLILFVFANVFTIVPCSSRNVPVKKDFKIIKAQYQQMVKKNTDVNCVPRTINEEGKLICTDIEDWTSGFFAGSLWYICDYTKSGKWKAEAEKRTVALEPLRNFTGHHDIGFMVYCSFGNGYRLTGNPQYKEIIADAANSLATRFDPRVGLIRSWDNIHLRDSEYLVIIDNMMNLELLFEAAKITGNNHFYDIAVSHADKTLKHHYRPDFSSYHLVDYDSITGEPRRKMTVQGQADSSAWSRGQAWGLYGFTICYRETKDKRYLDQAVNIADFILNHPNLPEDKVMYWDFDAPGIPNEERDVSATTVAASGLLELSKYVSPDDRKRFFSAAEEMLVSLSGPDYLAKKGENGNFILKKSVGSRRHNSEVSVPLNYADYYFLEALIRYDRY
jgi:hypothetical protein